MAEKTISELSEKQLLADSDMLVVENQNDTYKLAGSKIKYTAGSGITINNNTISAIQPTIPVTSVNEEIGDVVLTASDINASDNQSIQTNLNRIDASVDDVITDIADLNRNKQAKLTAGANITISNTNVISATTGGSEPATYLKSATVSANNKLTFLNKDNTTTVYQPNIPTKVSELTNDAGYLTQHQSLSAYRTASAQDVIDAGKQATLTAGTNITIENNVISATGSEPSAYIKNASVSGNTLTLTKKDNTTVTFEDHDTIYDDTEVKSDITTLQSNVTSLQTGKQNTLTAGQHISIDENNVIDAIGGVTGFDPTVSTNTMPAGGFNYGRKANTTVGNRSVALGYNVTATGQDSHAEGQYTLAGGNYSHTEGYYTTASGVCSHTEGQSTTASGQASHAEGIGTQASGYYSHAEGQCTIAKGNHQHAQGKFNIEDNNNKYAMIIGNGDMDIFTLEEIRSNALTVDWDGNTWMQGNVTAANIPAAPSADGNYVLKCSIVDGEATYSWVAE